MGLNLLLEAWYQLLGDDARTRPLHLLIAGAGEMSAALSEQITASGLTDSVTLLGQISDEDLANLYRASDVNIVPSLSFEGFGLVVLEAAAAGTPTIATRVGGLPEVLAGFDADLIVTAGKPDALALRLAAAERGELPDRRRTREWASGHSWDLVAERHRALYAGIVGDVPPKLRVAYVGHVAQLSGGEIALARLINALDDVEAHVILAEDGPLVGRLLAAGVSVEVLPMRERTRDLRKDRVGPGRVPLAAVLDTTTYAFRLARRLYAIRPGLVHTNTLKAGIYGSFAARLARVPAVWHVRDRIAPDYLPRPAVWPTRVLIAALPHGVVANSAATRATLRSSQTRTSVVYDPVPPPLRMAHESDERFVVGMLGRFAPWKGQHVFLEAFAQAFDGGSEVAVLVGDAMFGSAEVDYGRGLRELTRKLDIEERVDFRGFREDVWTELANMNICVHASLVPEPYGQVIIEAMVAGVPVIATEGGGPSEILTNDLDGLLYRAGDVDVLADALRRLAGDAALRERLVANARLRAQQFSPQAAAAKLMPLYRSVLGP
jgi:glycosyltransferase involved in cell wall biosynthesis